MRALRGLFGVLILILPAMLPAQQPAEVERLLEKVKEERGSDKDAARRDLRAAWDLVEAIDPSFRHESGFSWRWRCASQAWGLDPEVGEAAWRGVLGYYDPSDRGQLAGLQDARGQLAAVLSKRHEDKEAIELRRTIVADWEKAGEKLRAAWSRAELGQALVLGTVDDGLEGLSELEKAHRAVLALVPDSRDLAWVAQMYANSMVDMGQNVDPRVLSLQQSALDYWRRHPPAEPEDKDAWISLQWETANTLAASCQLQEARALAQGSLEAAVACYGKDDPATFWPRGFYALMLKDMGDFETALQLNRLNQQCASSLAWPDERRQRAWGAIGHTLLVMAQRAQEGTEERRDLLDAAIDALEHAMEEVDPNEKTPLFLTNVSSIYDNLGYCLSSVGRTAEAEALLKKALEVQNAGAFSLAQSEGGMAMVLQDAGRFEEAAEYFDRAVPVVVAQAGGHRQPVYYLRRQALTLSALGEGERLQQALERLLDVGHSALEECYRLPGRPSFELARIADTAAEQVLALAKETKDRATLERRAFELLESLRGIAERMTSVSTRLKDIPGVEDQLRKSRAARKGLARMASLGEGEDSEVFAVALRRDQAEFRALAELLAKANLPVVDVTVDAIAAHLPKDAAVVAFRVVTLVTPDPDDKRRELPTERLEAHLVTRSKDGRGRYERVDLGDPEPMRAAADAWRRTITGSDTRGVSDGKKQPSPDAALDAIVFQKLKKPLTAAKAKVLVVCLDDELHRVPIELLKSARDYKIRIAVSLSALVAPAEQELAEPSLFVIGGVDFANAPDGAATSPVRPGGEPSAGETRRGLAPRPGDATMVKGMKFGPLDLSGPEAEAVAKAFAVRFGKVVTPRTGRGVSYDTFTAQAQQARYLHLVTHGYFLRADEYGSDRARDRAVRGFAPMSLCGLALTGADLTGEDGHEEFVGVITGEEVAALDLSGCELAVLSACDTYLGETRHGHGLASLQSALHAAGARFVITTRWMIEDEPAKRLMEQFYLQLWSSKGMRPRDALEAAKTYMRTQGYKQERDWAGFVLTNDLADSAPLGPRR